VRILEGHTDSVLSLALSNEVKMYSASMDTTIRVWSAVDGTHLGTLKGHTDEVNAVAVGADGTVYSGSDDNTLRMWSGLDGSSIREVRMPGEVMTIAIGPGSTVLIGDGNNRVSAWSGGAAPVRTVYTSTSCVDVVAIGQDGRVFVKCEFDRKIYEL
jgi:WD40 repeat protein